MASKSNRRFFLTKSLWIFVFLVAMASLASCSMADKRTLESKPYPSSPSADKQVPYKSSEGGVPGGSSNAPSTRSEPKVASHLAPQTTIPTPTPEIIRKIVKTGDIRLVVKTYEPFSSALEKQVSVAGGYISQAQINRGPGEISSAQIILRIPPDKLDLLVSWLRDQGIVTSENIKADDISEQYYDLKSRLDNARKFEARLLDMLKTQTGNLQELVLVEEKLNQVREQIEQFEGKIRYFDNIAAMSTLTLNVSVEEHYVSPKSPTFGDRAAEVWRDSVQALVAFIQGLGLIVVGLIPWLIPLGIILAIGWYLLKFIWRFLTRLMNKEPKP